MVCLLWIADDQILIKICLDWVRSTCEQAGYLCHLQQLLLVSRLDRLAVKLDSSYRFSSAVKVTV